MKKISLLLSAIFLFAPFASAHNLNASGWIRILPGSSTSAYLSLNNPSLTKDVEIVKFSIPIAKSVMLHQTEMSNDMSSMKMLMSLKLAPQETVKMEPKGMHLMISGLSKPLKVGQKVKLILKYSDGDLQTIWLIAKKQ